MLEATEDEEVVKEVQASKLTKSKNETESESTTEAEENADKMGFLTQDQVNAKAQSHVFRAADDDDDDDNSHVARLGHQETSLILQEMESIQEAAPNEWLLCKNVEQMLIRYLAHEDLDELEDALKGTLEEFIKLFPHISWRQGTEGVEFKILPDAVNEPRQLVIRIREMRDLYKVVSKPKDSRVIIPEIEFEIGENQQRQINTVFNHCAESILNLGVEAKSGAFQGFVLDRIADTLGELNDLLDVNKPWTFIVRDPSGHCIVKPDCGYYVLPMDREYDAENWNFETFVGDAVEVQNEANIEYKTDEYRAPKTFQEPEKSES